MNNEERREMDEWKEMSRLRREDLREMEHNPTTVMIEKQPLISLSLAISSFGWEVFGNENTGLHFVTKSEMDTDYYDSNSIQIIFGDEVKGATSLEEFQERAFVYGFFGKEDVINNFVPALNTLNFKIVEGGEV